MGKALHVRFAKRSEPSGSSKKSRVTRTGSEPRRMHCRRGLQNAGARMRLPGQILPQPTLLELQVQALRVHPGHQCQCQSQPSRGLCRLIGIDQRFLRAGLWTRRSRRGCHIQGRARLELQKFKRVSRIRSNRFRASSLG